MANMQPTTYAAAGVDIDRKESSISGLLSWLSRTHGFPGAVGRPVLQNGFYAAVHDLGNGLGVAISTDSVGTKVLVAQQAGRYDTVGIDCVAINANDIICVGARPIALVDCLSVQRVDGAVLEQIGKGLYEGAQQAGLAIAGGELAQIPEMLRGSGDLTGFDLVGTCIGVISLDRLLDGSAIRDGDAVVGLASSGVHANGLTLARKVLLGPDAYAVDARVPELSRPIGEELLEPARIYVRPVMELLEQVPDITGLAHVSGGGFLNLLRFNTACGFELNSLPEPPPVFRLIQQRGAVAAAEMYRTFNMGTGFCVVARPEAAGAVIATAGRHGIPAQVIGHARSALQGYVMLPQAGLVGEGSAFRPADEDGPGS